MSTLLAVQLYDQVSVMFIVAELMIASLVSFDVSIGKLTSSRRTSPPSGFWPDCMSFWSLGEFFQYLVAGRLLSITAHPLVAAPQDQVGSMYTGQVAPASIVFDGVRVILSWVSATPSGATSAATPGVSALEEAA